MSPRSGCVSAGLAGGRPRLRGAAAGPARCASAACAASVRSAARNSPSNAAIRRATTAKHSSCGSERDSKVPAQPVSPEPRTTHTEAAASRPAASHGLASNRANPDPAPDCAAARNAAVPAGMTRAAGYPPIHRPANAARTSPVTATGAWIPQMAGHVCSGKPYRWPEAAGAAPGCVGRTVRAHRLRRPGRGGPTDRCGPAGRRPPAPRRPGDDHDDQQGGQAAEDRQPERAIWRVAEGHAAGGPGREQPRLLPAVQPYRLQNPAVQRGLPAGVEVLGHGQIRRRGGRHTNDPPGRGPGQDVRGSRGSRRWRRLPPGGPPLRAVPPTER